MSEIVKTHISKSTIDDTIASFLYSVGYVDDDVDIQDIKLGKPDKDGLIPLSYKAVKKA